MWDLNHNVQQQILLTIYQTKEKCGIMALPHVRLDFSFRDTSLRGSGSHSITPQESDFTISRLDLSIKFMREGAVHRPWNGRILSHRRRNSFHHCTLPMHKTGSAQPYQTLMQSLLFYNQRIPMGSNLNLFR